MYEFNALLGRLVGARLSSVQFVLDYLQLGFDTATESPRLTCDVLPAVDVGERHVAPTTSGWADSLVTLIGQDVVATHEAAGRGLRLDLATGAIVLRPTADDLVGPEIAVLNGFADHQWMAWRPGEEAFEYL